MIATTETARRPARGGRVPRDLAVVTVTTAGAFVVIVAEALGLQLGAARVAAGIWLIGVAPGSALLARAAPTGVPGRRRAHRAGP